MQTYASRLRRIIAPQALLIIKSGEHEPRCGHERSQGRARQVSRCPQRPAVVTIQSDPNAAARKPYQQLEHPCAILGGQYRETDSAHIDQVGLGQFDRHPIKCRMPK
jgi:hypothetical protein